MTRNSRSPLITRDLRSQGSPHITSGSESLGFPLVIRDPEPLKFLYNHIETWRFKLTIHITRDPKSF